MRKVLLILMLFMTLCSYGQLHVKEGSFHKIDGYVMLDKKNHYDDNNRPMALIKISTENIAAEQRARLLFKGNLATYFDVQFKVGEIYLYLSTEATFLEIIHPDYGKTEYWLPEDLCDFCGYEMVLVSNFFASNDTSPKVNYLTINTDRPEAMIFIDDEFVGMQNVSKLLSIGDTHRWKIECDMYETEEGEVVVSKGEPVTINKQLQAAYGCVNVNTVPEDSALVYVDSKYLGMTPCTIDMLRSGRHKIVLVRESYKPHIHEFELNNRDTVNIAVDLVPYMAQVKVVADSLSQIYIDNQMKGKGEWTGRVSLGAHLFEARRPSHRTSYHEADVQEGDFDTIYLPSPQPVFGHVNVLSTPIGASIYIDGVYRGITPRVVNDLLIGEHELRLEKDNYAFSIRKINISEDLTLELNEHLKEGKGITIETDIPGDKIFIDRQYIGVSPQKLNMSYGVHAITIDRDGYTTDEVFNVSPASDTIVKIIFGKYVKIETDHVGDYVYVNDVEVGNSPCETYLSYGKHTLTVKRGNKSHSKVVLVERDDDVDKIKINLGREVTIKTMEKGDAVWVNKKLKGKTPCKVYLYYGEHEIKVVHKGNMETYKNITIEEESTQDEYMIYYGQLVRLESNKDGDEIYIDGKKIGVTPMELDLSFGNHNVKVKRHRKIDERVLYVSKDSETEYMFTPARETINHFNNSGVKFFSLNASSLDDDSMYGFSFGRYKKIGWYLSFMSNAYKKNGETYIGFMQFVPEYANAPSYNGDMEYDYGYGDEVDMRISAMAGCMFRITGPIYMKLGAGYGKYSAFRDNGIERYKIDNNTYEGLLLSAGLQFNLKSLNLSTELQSDPRFKNVEFKVGIGFSRKK